MRNRSIETAGYFWSMGAIKIIAIPVRQKIAPMISHRVGIWPSTAHSHAMDAAMYMPPYP